MNVINEFQDIIAVALQPEPLAFLTALAITFVATEPLKRGFRVITKRHGRTAPRVIAFMMGFGVALTMWPHDGRLPPVVGALFAAFGAPTFHKLFIVIVRTKFPKCISTVGATRIWLADRKV